MHLIIVTLFHLFCFCVKLGALASQGSGGALATIRLYFCTSVSILICVWLRPGVPLASGHVCLSRLALISVPVSLYKIPVVPAVY